MRYKLFVARTMLLVASGFASHPFATDQMVEGPEGRIELACAGPPLAKFWSALNSGTRVDPKQLEASAVAGDPEAQTAFGIAQVSEAGHGGKGKKGKEWMRRAANSGYGPAQFYLGLLYLSEKGRKDQDEGVVLMTQAADQSIVLARIYLGHFYSNLPGSRPDPEKAEKWYLSAADLGCISVRGTLGHMYADRGRPEDDIKAYMWFSLLLDDTPSAERASIAIDRAEVERRLTSERLAEAQRLAQEWKSKH